MTACLVLGGIIVGMIIMGLVNNAHKSSTETTTAAAPVQLAEKSSPEAPTEAPAPTAPTSYSYGAPAPVQTMPIGSLNTGTYYGNNNAVPPDRDIEYQQTSSGYTIYTGRKAVDSTQTVNVGTGAAYVVDQYGAQSDVSGQPIGRNGLRGNPCVDPASTYGASYGRNR
jgi:hypothetical protein